MRKIAFFLLLSLAMVGTASANTLDVSGSWAPSEIVVPVGPGPGPRALINDGSFENGPPPGSAWIETSNTGCEWIGDWCGVWGVCAFDGTFDFWAGGYCGTPNTNSVAQSIDIPLGCTELSFWYISFRPDVDDPPNNDHSYVSVDGTEIWTYDLVQANDTYPDFFNDAVNIDAYDGAVHTLAFGALSVGANTGNMRFDFIEINCGPTPTELTTWGSVKSLYR